jgi:uncharacterized membrane protein YozB (DUF420 family)
MLVVLGMLLVGIGFGYAVKNKEAIMQHKWILTTVLALTLIPVLLVMSPTMYRFYTDPDVIPLSSISVTQIVHTAVSIPALATAVIFASGKMPKNIKKGMRWAALFWIASMVLGVLLFLQMIELIPTF